MLTGRWFSTAPAKTASNLHTCNMSTLRKKIRERERSRSNGIGTTPSGAIVAENPQKDVTALLNQIRGRRYAPEQLFEVIRGSYIG